MQLGAYPNLELLEADLRRISSRHNAALARYKLIKTEETIAGRRLIRLVVSGFDDVRTALRVCDALRAKGTSCYVRKAAQGLPGRQLPGGHPITPSGTRWVVQLGAYPSPGLLEAAQRRIMRRHASLLAPYVLSRAEATVNGHRFTRLLVEKLPDIGAALRLCAALRSQGTSCYVHDEGTRRRTPENH